MINNRPKNVQPFSISPNPQSLYLTSSLRTTILKVKYVIDHRQGLTAILGDVGMGKSSIIRRIYGDYAASPSACAILLPSPSYSTDFAFLKGVCQEFGVKGKRSQLEQENELKNFLIGQYSKGENCVVFIDEAQRLTGKQLEQVRTMLNFETDREKLVQVVLSGQLELRDRLRDETKKAIRSRIFAPSLLDPLSVEETHQMIAFRCQLESIPNPFPAPVVDDIYRYTGGIPRSILKLCGLAYYFMQEFRQAEVGPDLLAQTKKHYELEVDDE
jgi:general secretion pathway protein A